MALYQQGNQKIEIIIRKANGGGNGEKGNKVKDENDDGKLKTWRDKITGTNSPTKQKRILITNTTHAVAITKQIADLSIEYFVGGLGYSNGDQAFQQRVSRQIEVFKDTTNMISSVTMGAVYGAWGGPIGSVLGASFALAQQTASLAFKYMNRDREFNMKLYKQESAIAYQQARANINLTTGRLR